MRDALTGENGLLRSLIVKGLLANSKTADRSYKANTLTENGTVPTEAVQVGRS